MIFVLDASVVSAWHPPDEAEAVAEVALERRGRVGPADVAEALAWLRQLPVNADRDSDDLRSLDLARQ